MITVTITVNLARPNRNEGNARLEVTVPATKIHDAGDTIHDLIHQAVMDYCKNNPPEENQEWRNALNDPLYKKVFGPDQIRKLYNNGIGG